MPYVIKLDNSQKEDFQTTMQQLESQGGNLKEDSPQPSTTVKGTFSNNDFASAAADQETSDIKRHNQSQAFDGSGYKPVDNSYLYGADIPMAPSPEHVREQEQNKAFNDALYRSQGYALIPGWEGGPRLQDVPNEQTGRNSRQIVPTDSMTGLERSVIGGVLSAAKSTAKFVAGGSGGLQFPFTPLPKNTEAVAKALENTNDNALIRAIDDNMPTMPAANWIEAAAQEIVAVSVGGFGGAAGAEKVIEKLPQAQRVIADIAAQWTKRQVEKAGKDADVVNIQKKTEVFLKSLVAEFAGSNVGSTITTPDGSDPMFGSHFADNTIASGLLRTFGFAGRAAGKYIGKALKLGTDVPTDPMGLAVMVFQKIDPDAVGATRDDFMQRMKNMQEILERDSTIMFPNDSFSPMVRSPQDVLAKSAREYVDKSYGYLRGSQFTDEQYEVWARDKASQVANEIHAMKRANLANPIVQGADAEVMRKGKEGLTELGNKIGTDPSTGLPVTPDDVNTAITQTPLENLNTANKAVRDATVANDANQAVVDELTNKDVFLNAVEQLKGSERFKTGQDANTLLKQNLTNRAYDNWLASRTGYKKLFDNLPLQVEFKGANDFANTMKSLGDQTDLRDFLMLNDGPLSNPHKAISGARPANGGPSEFEELQNAISGKDLRYFVSEVRPYLQARIADANLAAGTSSVNTKGYQQLIDIIDREAEQVPGFRDAMQAYRTHMETWADLEALHRVNRQAETTFRSGQLEKQLPQTIQDIWDVQESAIAGGDNQSGILFQKWREAAKATNGEVSDLIMYKITDALATSDKPNVKALSDAMQPYMPKLKEIDPQLADLLQNSLDNVYNAQKNLGDTTQALLKAKSVATEVKAKIADTAANEFIVQSSTDFGQAIKSDNTAQVFERIFSSVDSTNKLIKDAKAVGDPLVMQGIKAKYITNMIGNMFVTNKISAMGKDMEMVTNASLKNLEQFLTGSNDTQRKIFGNLFSDDPKYRDDILLMLEALRDNVAVRSNKIATFGSDTALNIANKNRLASGSLVLNVALGRLNRTATTMGALSRAMNDVYSQKEAEAYMTIVPKLLTDARYLSKMLDEVTNAPDKMRIVERYVDDIIRPSAAGTISKGVATAMSNESEPRRNVPSQEDTAKALGNGWKPEKAAPRNSTGAW